MSNHVEQTLSIFEMADEDTVEDLVAWISVQAPHAVMDYVWKQITTAMPEVGPGDLIVARTASEGMVYFTLYRAEVSYGILNDPPAQPVQLAEEVPVEALSTNSVLDRDLRMQLLSVLGDLDSAQKAYGWVLGTDKENDNA